jgi:hypothetical protein
LVALAVSPNGVSGAISPLTGKNTGKIGKIAVTRDWKRTDTSLFRVLDKIPHAE